MGARKWYEKSAKQGNPGAQFNLGVMYYEGKGVSQDYSAARKWYVKAAEQGNALAQYNLGFMYSEGKGVTQDYTKAQEWYEKSAKLRNQAQFWFSLGASGEHGPVPGPVPAASPI